MLVRPPRPDDRNALQEALQACGAFTDVEVGVALEMIDDGLGGDYTLLGVEVDGVMRAYACIGPAWLTEGSWYLYWICAHPAVQGGGVAVALQDAVESHVRAAGGKRLVLETSGRTSYARARRFYERAGYGVCGRIPDFYRVGDDCVVYVKALLEMP